jgi:BMFP domain-containing protein YqiC
MAILTVPRVLREKLGEEGAEALVELLNTIGHQERDNLLVLVEERFARRVGEESAHLKGHVSEVKSVLEGQIREVEAKLENQIREVEAKLANQIREVETKLEKRVGELESKFEVRLAQVRADLIRWMFIFWAGQIGVLVALLALFFRLLQG